MFCDKCGRELESNARFCKYCGAEVRDASPPVPPIQNYAQPVQQVYAQPAPQATVYISPNDFQPAYQRSKKWGKAVKICSIISPVIWLVFGALVLFADKFFTVMGNKTVLVAAAAAPVVLVCFLCVLLFLNQTKRQAWVTAIPAAILSIYAALVSLYGSRMNLKFLLLFIPILTLFTVYYFIITLQKKPKEKPNYVLVILMAVVAAARTVFCYFNIGTVDVYLNSVVQIFSNVTRIVFALGIAAMHLTFIAAAIDLNKERKNMYEKIKEA